MAVDTSRSSSNVEMTSDSFAVEEELDQQTDHQGLVKAETEKGSVTDTATEAW